MRPPAVLPAPGGPRTPLRVRASTPRTRRRAQRSVVIIPTAPQNRNHAPRSAQVHNNMQTIPRHVVWGMDRTLTRINVHSRGHWGAALRGRTFIGTHRMVPQYSCVPLAAP